MIYYSEIFQKFVFCTSTVVRISAVESTVVRIAVSVAIGVAIRVSIRMSIRSIAPGSISTISVTKSVRVLRLEIRFFSLPCVWPNWSRGGPSRAGLWSRESLDDSQESDKCRKEDLKFFNKRKMYLKNDLLFCCEPFGLFCLELLS